MALSTYTASSQTATPKAIHAGITVARATFTLNAAASTTISDVVKLIKIPNHATIIDGYLTGTHPGAATVLKVGTAADDDCGTAAATLSATTQKNDFDNDALPFKVSISDDVNPQWTWLQAEIVTNTSSSLTMSIKCVVLYTMDDIGA